MARTSRRNRRRQETAPPNRRLLAAAAAALIMVLFSAWFIWNRSQQEARATVPLPVAEFDIEQAEIIYAVPDQPDRNRLFRASLSEREPQLVAESPLGIINYDVSPDGSTLVHSAWRDDGGADLWSVALPAGEPAQLLSCVRTLCTHPKWSPDGGELAYVRRPLDPDHTHDDGTVLDHDHEDELADDHTHEILVPEIWRFDWDSGETEPMFGGDAGIGYGSEWSPDGRYLSYVSPPAGASWVVALSDGQRVSFPNGIGIIPAWGPTSESLLGVDTQVTNEDARAVGSLLRYDRTTEQLTTIVEDVNMLDDAFGWSPAGDWIALLRPDRHGETSSLGGQVWLVRPDGSGLSMLTREPDMQRLTLFWSPDGSSLLVAQRPLKVTRAPMEIWLLDVASGEMEKLVEGDMPAWLPQ